MATTEASKALQVILDPETGQLIEVNLDNAAQPDSADLRKAHKLHEIEGPFAILGVKIEQGKTFEKEYATFLYAQRPKVEMGVTASAEIVATLRRVMARGLATPNAPLLTKAVLDTKTSAGYFVHKLEQLTTAEEAQLRTALKRK